MAESGPPSELTSTIPSAMLLTDLASLSIPPSQVKLLSKSAGVEVFGSASAEAAFKSRPKLDYARPLQERICFFLDQDLGTDVKFVVGEGEEAVVVGGHKIILASASPVFFSMFFSDLDSENEVRIPDCDPQSFKALVHFIYRGKIGALVVSERACELLYIARKYAIRQLEDECCLHLSASVSAHSVFQTLEVASLYDLPALSLICWEYIQEATQEVLNHNLPTLSLPLLTHILNNDHLNISELSLFQIILQWGKDECERRGVETGREELRSVLSALMPLIRFPAMFPHELADEVVPSGMLSSDQIANIYTFIYASEESKRPQLDCNPQPRTPLSQHNTDHRPLRYGALNQEETELDRGRRSSRYASLIMPPPDLSDSPDDALNDNRTGPGGRPRRRSRRNRNRNRS